MFTAAVNDRLASAKIGGGIKVLDRLRVLERRKVVNEKFVAW